MREGRLFGLAQAILRPRSRGSLLLGLLLSALPAILVPGAEAANHEPSPTSPAPPAEHSSAAAPKEEATNAPNRTAWEYFADPNTDRPKEKNPKVDFAARLEIARHHRLARQYGEATSAYAALLEENSPEPIQKIALLELAQMACEQNDLSRAEQVLSQWLARWPEDPKGPEILLRQGLIYRQMGLHSAAITKFYAVLTSALVLKPESFSFYQKLVLRAQNEIAETQFQLANWADAANSFGRLLRLDAPAANHAALQHRYIQCLAALGRHNDTVTQAEDFLQNHANAPERPEVRFLCASALKQAGRNAEALRQVLSLLEEQHAGQHDLQTLTYWQRRAGNEIANRFYQEGDTLKALDVYLSLAALDPQPAWQLPIHYQIGLIYERLSQPAKAGEFYASILGREKDVGKDVPPSLRAILEMAKWRKDHLDWQIKAEQATQGFRHLLSGTNTPASGPEKALAQNKVTSPTQPTSDKSSPPAPAADTATATPAHH